MVGIDCGCCGDSGKLWLVIVVDVTGIFVIGSGDGLITG